jgi:hypothetical protein
MTSDSNNKYYTSGEPHPDYATLSLGSSREELEKLDKENKRHLERIRYVLSKITRSKKKEKVRHHKKRRK